MTVLLAGDIGGTKTILRLVEMSTDEKGKFDRQTCLKEATYPSQNYPDLTPIVREFLAGGDLPKPTRACFAIAGPVVDNTCALTNLDWQLAGRSLAVRFRPGMRPAHQ